MMKINYLHVAFLSILSLQNLTAQTYCTSKGNLPWNEWIANVQFATINHASVKEGYGNFTSQTATVNRGGYYTFRLTRGFSWEADPSTMQQEARVWIDYNQNGVFDANELVANFPRSYSDIAIQIPTTALLGVTRMRVSLKTLGAPTACEVFDRGEVEDYTVNITAPAGAPNLLITNVTGPASAKPGDTITLTVSVSNTGTGSTVPTRLQYRQKHFNNGYTTALCPQTVTIPALAPNESKVITYPLTLTNPIYPPNAIYVAAFETFINHGFQEYLLMASNGDMSDQAPYYTEPKYAFNIPITFPKTDIAISVAPNTVSLRENEPWRATYSIKNKGNFIVKQAFVNLGDFQNFGRNYFPGAYKVDSTSRQTTNSLIRIAGSEVYRLGWEVFDLNPGESRNVTLYFSPVVRFSQVGTVQLPAPSFNPFSNVIDTTDNFALNTYIIYNGSPQPDLTLANLNLTNSTVQQGQVLNYKFDLKNIGLGNASGSFNVKSYISRDNVLSSDDIQDGIVPTGNFNAGFSVLQVPAASTIPATLAAGQYYLILKADADNLIVENNENNNIIVSLPFQVTMPNQNSCKSYVTENTLDKCGSAPTWKPYGLKLYNYTTQQYEFYKIENGSFSSDNNKGLFVGTFRTASWQPIQVKAYFKFFPSNGYRGSACGTGIQDTTGWRFPVADSGKIVFPDKTLAISGQSYREGQMGMGANTQDLTDLGFYSVARCANVSNLANDYNAFFTFKLTNETACNALNYSKSNSYESIDVQQNADFNIFPNPAREEIFLDLKDFENQPIEITVSDVAGKAVLNQTIQNTTTLSFRRNRLDISRLQNGTYFVHIQIVGQRSMARTFYILK
jgi:hypothetical protein